MALQPESDVDLFAVANSPVPAIDDAAAAELGSRLTGRPVTATSLGSQQDANFLLADGDGPVGVLKVANAGFRDLEVDCQDAAAAHLAAALPGTRFCSALEGTRGRVAVGPTAHSIARVLRFLPGGTLNGSGYLDPVVVRELGRLSGLVSVALRDFTHPGLDRILQWDPRQADRALDALTGAVADDVLRARVERVRAEAWPLVTAVADELPMQAVHCDVTDDNVVCRTVDGLRMPDGVIDFGDTCSSWAVSELAVTVSSLLHHEGMTPVGALAAVAAFAEERPLSAAEADVLWPLVVLRGAVLVASGHHQLAVDGGDNAYAAEGLVREQIVFDRATSVPLPVMQAAVRLALGIAEPPVSLPAHHGPLARPGQVAVLDLSVTSDELHAGRWLEPGIEEELAVRALDGGAAAVVTRFAEQRATRAVPLSRTAPATGATGTDVWFAEDTELTAPWAGQLLGNTVLVGADCELRLSGPAGAALGPGADRAVDGGEVLGTVPGRTRLRVTAVRRRDDAPLEVPDVVVPEVLPAWLRTLADPAALLASPPALDSRPGDLLERRDAHLAEVQEHYYADPPQIERGWREHLLSTTGRSYLDMVNNVAVLGHGDPELAAAVHRQLSLLNTNSRFHYRAVVEFSEQLAATLPAPLDTVFLVNSGSEAVDLALRIAMAATGRTDVLAVGEAYHGWTYATDAVSTSVADNPNALATRPDWVHVLDAPNSYRGTHRGADAGRYAVDAVARVDALAAAGRAPGAFVAEPVYGNAGGLLLPDGYLPAVYAAVRRHGGLAIADEVQVGYGRLGHSFWAFEQQGVLPDVVTIAKAMGNGHPLGAVITSRAVAARYRTQGYFFSSAGGSPVSSVVGSFVLRAIRERGLQENARDVGDHLKRRIEALMDRHPLIGVVHGQGLYLGVELVRDRQTLEPATEETARLCDRLLGLGVVVQPTGDRLNVLKVKPPMVLGRDGADFFVDTLDHALGTAG